MIKKGLLDEAWEEYGVIGTRIEIHEPNITILWRNSPVLTTKFKKIQKKDGIELVLEKNGLRYENSFSDYATLVRVFYQEEKIEITKFFPITGDAHTILQRTDNSRFGNNKIVDEILKELEGTWRDEKGFYKLKFQNDELIMNDRKVKVHILHSNSLPDEIAEYKIVDQDPSKMELFNFSRLEYSNGRLIGYQMIYDAQLEKIIFYRE